MKYLAVILLLSLATCLLASAPSGIQQNIVNSTAPAISCTTPTGANFTESFGDSATSCWAAGPSSCNQTWTINAGAAESIITSPGGAPANTACTNSLQFAEDGATQSSIQVAIPALTSGTNYDVTFTLYVTSSSLGSGQQATVLCITGTSANCDTTHIIMGARIANPSASLTVIGLGTGNSASAGTIVTGTWHTIVLHHDSVAANCSVALDGGGAQTFTCNAITSGFMIVGPVSLGFQANTFVVGNVSF